MNLFTVLRNIYLKIQKNINVERITNSEIDDAFGEAAGTGTDAQDYVVEHGTTTASDGSYWIYRKWASGIAECWGRKVYNINQYSTFGTSEGMWWAYQVDIYYPFTFIEKPLIFPDSTVSTAFTITTIVESTTTTEKVTVFSATHNTSGYLDNFIRVHAVGKWK